MRGFCAALALLVLAGAADVRAQTYPLRPITLVVPFPPGGSTTRLFPPSSSPVTTGASAFAEHPASTTAIETARITGARSSTTIPRAAP